MGGVDRGGLVERLTLVLGRPTREEEGEEEAAARRGLERTLAASIQCW